jgi:2-polyprenyl-3-methyl-5-hydroxy-6-metoxy-1,4-benzoquinol methylase
VTKKKYIDTHSYWERRLASDITLRGTGHRAFSLDYNHWLYQAQLDSVNWLFKEHHVDVEGRDVLDVGSGSGVYVDYFQQRGSRSVTGVDVAPSSVNYLQTHFPTGKFYLADISDPELSLQGKFGIISVMSVLYHIIEDERFKQALQNLCELIGEGGYILISDTFAHGISITAKHAHFRPLKNYLGVFSHHNIAILQILPLYYLLNRTFIPLVGPLLAGTLRLGRLFYHIDSRFRTAGFGNGAGMKLMLAQKQ